MMSATNPQHYFDLESRFGAHNYHPLPVVLERGEGCWVYDVQGKRYFDALAGYSALNFGHQHPVLVKAAAQQLGQLTLTSRAFFHNQLGPFCQELSTLCGLDCVLPMNSGAEAVETALKLARRWGYQKKSIPPNEATILVVGGNFHGRTISIISFSDDELSRGHFGPYTPGFVQVPYADIDALERAMNPSVAAVLMEPIQGEAGVVIPPDGYLTKVQELCRQHNTLMMLDEIQSGLGRTGKTFAFEHEDLRPDVLILGKALGGGIVPLSAVASRREVMEVFTPGTHGSTFGGNPLACAVGRAVMGLLADGQLQAASAKAGQRLARELEDMASLGIQQIRVRGLWAGIDIDPALATGRRLCESALSQGLLLKDTHGSTVRISPPLVANEEDLTVMLESLRKALVALG